MRKDLIIGAILGLAVSAPILWVINPYLYDEPEYSVQATFEQALQLTIKELARPLGSTQVQSETVKARVVAGSTDVVQGQAFVIEVMFSPTGSGGLVPLILSRSQARLHLAGATVSPSGLQNLGRDLRTSWSIRIDSEGVTEGFIELIPEVLQSGALIELSGSRVDFQVTSNQKPLSFLDAYAKPAGIILAIVISITNIVTFLWSWRDRRTKIRKIAQEKSQGEQRLILPNSKK